MAFSNFQIMIFNEHLMSYSKNVLISMKKYNCLIQVLFVNHFFVLQARLLFLHLEVTSDFYFPCVRILPPSSVLSPSPGRFASSRFLFSGFEAGRFTENLIDNQYCFVDRHKFACTNLANISINT